MCVGIVVHHISVDDVVSRCGFGCGHGHVFVVVVFVAVGVGSVGVSVVVVIAYVCVLQCVVVSVVHRRCSSCCSRWFLVMLVCLCVL